MDKRIKENKAVDNARGEQIPTLCALFLLFYQIV
jgi:hypothetical protein